MQIKVLLSLLRRKKGTAETRYYVQYFMSGLQIRNDIYKCLGKKRTKFWLKN